MELQEFTDIDGRRRVFEIRSVSVPTGFEYEAVEIQQGEPKGMRFSVLGDKDKADILKNRLEEKIKKALAIRHLKYHEETSTSVVMKGQSKI